LDRPAISEVVWFSYSLGAGPAASEEPDSPAWRCPQEACLPASPIPSDHREAELTTIAAMEIFINGQAQHCASGCTLAELIVQLGLTGKRLAIERNQSLVPRSQHAQVELQEGDHLEIVIAVGGG
jgi:sulfur carrier protein